jgi:hypothetical protein
MGNTHTAGNCVWRDRRGTRAPHGFRGSAACSTGLDGVAVVADSWWQANRTGQQLEITWDEGDIADQSTTDFAATAVRMSKGEPETILRKDGDTNAAFGKAAHVVEAAYNARWIQPLLAELGRIFAAAHRAGLREQLDCREHQSQRGADR